MPSGNKTADDLPYKIGGLLYIPALNSHLAVKLIGAKNPYLTSIAFCLEDAVLDCAVREAEQKLAGTLAYLKAERERGEKLPLFFIRVRNPRHLDKVHTQLGGLSKVLTGYILPKFDMSNQGEYLKLVSQFNNGASKNVYFMPILESKPIADAHSRVTELANIKRALKPFKELVLNIRVGGNDFCNLYGLRRHATQTIYDISVVRSILTDILNVFSAEYVISGPCWEYFGSDLNEPWAKGLKRELELDKLNGFIGKTAIHPSQLKLIYENMTVGADDFEDAKKIVNWSSNRDGVAKSADGTRMNELNCHGKWARKICALASIYGVRES